MNKDRLTILYNESGKRFRNSRVGKLVKSVITSDTTKRLRDLVIDKVGLKEHEKRFIQHLSGGTVGNQPITELPEKVMSGVAMAHVRGDYRDRREFISSPKYFEMVQAAEKEAKGRLLSIKETAMMTRKEEIEEEILDLEEKSRGWFEDDDDFQLRVAASRAKKIVVKKTIVKTSGSSSANGGAKKPITNWIVPGASAKKQANIKKTKTKTASSNAFAAMMMDSDSDSD